MRLKTKLVLSAMAVTFLMVLVLSIIFLGQLMQQRVSQTASDNEVLTHEVVLMTRQAIEIGLRENPPADRSDEAFQVAVSDALRSHQPLSDTMDAIVRYSPTIQDVSVTDAHGLTLVSTDPDTLDQPAPTRTSLLSVRDGSSIRQWQEMFVGAHVLDIGLPLDRNGLPFLVVHVGVRSTFLRAIYLPFLRGGLSAAVGAALLAMLAAAFLANSALRPIQWISEELERLTSQASETAQTSQLNAPRQNEDTVVRVSRTIDRLGRQIRSTEAEYTALQTNLNRMLDTLRDGVLLFTADRRAAMVSDAVAHFINRHDDLLVGKTLEEIFPPDTHLGLAVFEVFDEASPVTATTVALEDGRRIHISVDRIGNAAGEANLGTLVTLRDTESAIKLEQELEVSRRLVAIGRLTAGVGHEVKNPINAMVLHLELLRSKLAGENGSAFPGAQRHVDILSGEMQRLDRVVQTLADFTRPMELQLGQYDLRHVIDAVIQLTGAQMSEQGVHVEWNKPARPVPVRIDDDLIRQAMLNLLLNAMEAMPQGGTVRVNVRREGDNAAVEVIDEGEGIPPELLPRIFELYFTTKSSGSGIGLAMTYRILQMHSGAIEVRSSTNPSSAFAPRGTIFTLRLPIATKAMTSEISQNKLERLADARWETRA
jgi:signal transduction histidine kinase